MGRLSGLAEIPAGKAVSLEREVLPCWVGRGLFGYPHGQAFLDIGTPVALGQAHAFLAG